MPAIPTSASQALGVSQQFQPGSFQAMLDQQNNDMLLKQKRQKLLPNGQPDPNAVYSDRSAYNTLFGNGGI